MTRARLSAIYVGIMFAGLLVLAAAAVFTLDRTLRSSLDSRLATESKAAAVFADVKKGKLAVDSDDRAQFLAVLGAGSAGFVSDLQGNVVLSSAANPLRMPGSTGDRGRYFDAGSGERAVRAFASPVVSRLLWICNFKRLTSVFRASRDEYANARSRRPD